MIVSPELSLRHTSLRLFTVLSLLLACMTMMGAPRATAEPEPAQECSIETKITNDGQLHSLGDIIPFTVVVTNLGSVSTLENVISSITYFDPWLVDPDTPPGQPSLPRHLSGLPDNQINGLTAKLGDIAPGQSVTYTFLQKIVPGGDDTDAHVTSLSQSAGACAKPTPDISHKLQVEKHLLSDPNTLSPGKKISYGVTVHNGGSDEFDVVADDLPISGLTRVTMSDPSVGTVSGTHWTIGNMRSNDSATVIVNGTVSGNTSPSEQIVNDVTVSNPWSPVPENPSQTNNSQVTSDIDQWDQVSNAMIIPEIPVLKVEKHQIGDLASVGRTGTITYQVTAKNASAFPAENVVVNDLGGANLSGITLSTPRSGTVNGSIWTLPVLAAGASETITVNATVSPQGRSGGTIVNAVDISGPLSPTPDTRSQVNNNDVDADTDQWDQSTTTLPRAVKVEKHLLDDPASLAPGSIVRYGITVRNPGDSVISGVSVSDLPVSGLDSVTISGISVGTVSNFSWNIGTLNPGDQVTAVATGKITDTHLDNIVQVTADGLPLPSSGPVQTNNDDVNADTDQRDEVISTTGTIGAQIAKSAVSVIQSSQTGDQVTFRITARNSGTLTTHNNIVTDIPVSGVTGTALSNASVGVVNGMVWTIGDLAPGATATIMVTGTLDGSVVENRVSISADNLPAPTGTPIQPNNSDVTADTDQRDVVTGTPGTPKIQISKKSVSDVSASAAGDNATYLITVHNPGSITAKNVVVSDQAVSGLTNVSMSVPSMGTVDGAVWTVGDLAPGATATVTVTGRLDGSKVINDASVSAANLPTPTGTPIQVNNDDVNADTDQRDEVVQTPGIRSVQIAKDALTYSGALQTGDTARFRITVRNSGTVQLTDVKVSDLPVSGLTETALVDPSVGTVTGLSWSVGDLAPGATVTISVTGVVTGRIINDALVSADGLPTPTGTPIQVNNDDVNADTDQRDEVTGTPGTPKIQIAKKADADITRLHSGQNATFTITVHNPSDVPAKNVVVNDNAISGLTGITMSTPSIGTVDNATWTVGDLAPGATTTVKVTGRLDGNRVVNDASVSAVNLPTPTGTPIQVNNDDVNADTDQRDEVTGTPGTIGAQVAKTAVSVIESSQTGDTVTFRITAKNNGTLTTHNNVVSENPVSGLDSMVLSGPSVGTVSGLVWTIGDLAPGQTENITVTAKLNGNPVRNEVSISADDLPSPNNSPIQPNNTDVNADIDQRDVVTGNPGTPKIQIAKKATSDVVTSAAGDSATYLITVHNPSSTVLAKNVVVTDNVISGLTDVVMSAQSAGTISGTSWSVGDMAPGTTATVTVTGRLTGEKVVNDAVVNAVNLPAPDTGAIQVNNDDVNSDTDQRDEVVQTPGTRDVQIAKSSVTPIDALQVGDTSRFIITVRNSGTVGLTGVTVSDLPVSGLDKVTLSEPSTGTINGTVWTVGNMAPGATATVMVTGVIDGHVVNDASVFADGLPTPTDTPIQVNNSDVTADTDQRDEVIGTPGTPKIQIAKKSNVDISGLHEGQDARFTITVKNPSATVIARDVRVSDHLVSGLTGLTLVDPSTGNVSGTIWTVGDLMPNATATITATGRLDGSRVVNDALVSAVNLPTPTGTPIQVNNADVNADTDQRDEVIGTPAPIVTIPSTTDVPSTSVTSDITVTSITPTTETTSTTPTSETTPMTPTSETTSTTSTTSTTPTTPTSDLTTTDPMSPTPRTPHITPDNTIPSDQTTPRSRTQKTTSSTPPVTPPNASRVSPSPHSKTGPTVDTGGHVSETIWDRIAHLFT